MEIVANRLRGSIAVAPIEDHSLIKHDLHKDAVKANVYLFVFVYSLRAPRALGIFVD